MKGLMEELLMASQWEQNQRMLMYLKLGKKKKRHEVGFAKVVEFSFSHLLIDGMIVDSTA